MGSWGAQVFLGHTPACYVVVQGSLVPPGQVPPWGNVPLDVGLCAVAGWLVVAPRCLCTPSAVVMLSIGGCFGIGGV